MEDIDQKVIEIVSEQMGVDKSEITRETHFINDLNADSLDTVELVMEFEDEFELSIPDEEAEKKRIQKLSVRPSTTSRNIPGNRDSGRPAGAIGPGSSPGLFGVIGPDKALPAGLVGHEQTPRCYHGFGGGHLPGRNR